MSRGFRDDYDPPGPGTSKEDEYRRNAIDGEPKTGAGVRKGSGASASGPSRRRRRTPNKLLAAWYDVIDPLSWGRSTVSTVDAPRFLATINRIRTQLDPEDEERARTDELIIDGFKKFGLAIEAGWVSIENKPAFSVFTSRWATYITAPKLADEDETEDVLPIEQMIRDRKSARR